MMSKKTLYIDGDGCNQNTRELAERLGQRGVRVVIVANRDIPCTQEGTELVKCTSEIDAADSYITSHCRDGDLVITRDLSLSAILLKKLPQYINVISDNGEVYTADIIDTRIIRAEHSKERRIFDSTSTPANTHKKKKDRATRQSKNSVADYLEKWRLGLL